MEFFFGDTSSNYGFQVNIYNYEWINHDDYNRDSTNASWLSVYNLPWMLTFAILSMGHQHAGKLSWLEVVAFAPAMLINSQHHYILINRHTGSKSFFSSSVYFKTKLDYFAGRNNDWWRYKPGLGIEVAEMLSVKKKITTSIGIAISAGIDKPIDFGIDHPKKNNWTPSLGFKLIWGVI